MVFELTVTPASAGAKPADFNVPRSLLRMASRPLSVCAGASSGQIAPSSSSR